jgi:hypothetical protein
MRPVLLFCFFVGCLIPCFAQSTAFVPMGGLTVGSQRYNNGQDQQSLWAWHAALGIESVNNENDNASLIMQVGYHVKGSASRFRTVNLNGFPTGQFTEEYQFHNISTMFGAKMKRPMGDGKRWYYFGGIRTDYTLSTNVDELATRNPQNALFYPQIGAVNRWMVGVSGGAGMELRITDLVGGELRLTVAPDFTAQVNQVQSPPLINPFDPSGPSIIIPAKQVRNVSIELSFGLRLLRKVEYVGE